MKRRTPRSVSVLVRREVARALADPRLSPAAAELLQALQAHAATSPSRKPRRHRK